MDIEDLEVYQLAEKLSDVIWNIVLSWERFPKETIGKQLVRAVDSIASNIAEGYGRYHYKENKNFCYFARGSLEETKTWLRKGIRRDLINQSEQKELSDIMERLPKLLNAYIGSIGPQKAKVTSDQ